MSVRYDCGSERRREAVRSTVGTDGRPVLNGIDYVEVASADQTTLELVFIHNLPGQADGVPDPGTALTRDNVVIDGGVRVQGIEIDGVSAAGNVLTVTVDEPGDFSTYTLRLIAAPGESAPPDGFDVHLGEVPFSFKADCRSDFDCEPDTYCPPDLVEDPPIDLLAKDYASFRRLMLDRMAVSVPEWTDRNAADPGVTLVEVLAYAGDHLSYHQDAVATEAYLGTARERASVRRHARLLDYTLHEGANARAWVAVTVDPAADGTVLPGPATRESGAVEDRGGTVLTSRIAALPARLSPEDLRSAMEAGAQVFETMHDLTVRSAYNEIRFYTWGEKECCLPVGATGATLQDPGNGLLELGPGSVLIFEETRSPTTGRPEDADPSRRHAVRLTHVRFTEDPLFPETPGDPPGTQRLRLAEVEWHRDDALPFPLCVEEVDGPGGDPEAVSVARGNVVLVDHGLTMGPRSLGAATASPFRPILDEGRLAWRRTVRLQTGERVPFDPDAPARKATGGDVRDALPAVFLREAGAEERLWSPGRDLLASSRFDRDFVVEADGNGGARLRFGDDRHGRCPDPGTELVARYRLGGGRVGNVGADAIAHIVSSDTGILSVRNPLASTGGEDPEPEREARLYAPQAFRSQQRAVTEEDYERAAQLHPDVQRAAATFRWTGSWHTVFLTVDRFGGRVVDRAFEAELVDFMERFPLAGYDLEVEPPRFVPVELVLTVCAHHDFVAADVKEALLQTFSSEVLSDGRVGFFHPDRFTFGESVFLSQIVSAAMAVPGVLWVDTDATPPKKNRFKRWDRPAGKELELGFMAMGRLEIARLDNDPSVPEYGRLEILMEGGR